jgi:hypothetical protein
MGDGASRSSDLPSEKTTEKRQDSCLTARAHGGTNEVGSPRARCCALLACAPSAEFSEGRQKQLVPCSRSLNSLVFSPCARAESAERQREPAGRRPSATRLLDAEQRVHGAALNGAALGLEAHKLQRLADPNLRAHRLCAHACGISSTPGGMCGTLRAFLVRVELKAAEVCAETRHQAPLVRLCPRGHTPRLGL